MTSAAAEAMHRRGIVKVGESVTFQRVSGAAPNTSTFSATVTALVRNYMPDTASPARDGYGSSELGGLTQGARQIIVVAGDLAAKHFPLPLRKNDRAILLKSGEKLNILSVDASKRGMAGAIEIMATGTA